MIIPFPRLLSVFDPGNAIFRAEKNGSTTHARDIPPPDGLVGDFSSVGREWAPIHIGFGMLAFSEPTLNQLKKSGWPCDGMHPFSGIKSSRKSVAGNPPRYWVLARVEPAVTTLEKNVRTQWGFEVAATSFILADQTFPRREFIRSAKTYSILCPLEFLILARRYKWANLRFCPADLPQSHYDNYGIDYLGEQWPPQWWPDGYEPHPSNVTEAEVPDVKVGEGLVDEFAPAAAKPISKE